MPDYFLSDVHLCLDRPQRAQRLARFVDALESADSLTIGGDLCDFWFASREVHTEPMRCPGLASLAEFARRGGQLSVIRGNHDASLIPFYEAKLGARVQLEPLQVVSHGVRVHLVHGHLVSGPAWWKRPLESELFLRLFARLPHGLAAWLRKRLDRANQRNLQQGISKHVAVFRHYVEQHHAAADLFLFGHVHRPTDEQVCSARMVILGGWNNRVSYLRIDDAGAHFTVEN